MYHLPDPTTVSASPAASIGKSKSKAKSHPHLRGHKQHLLPISPLSASISASHVDDSQPSQPISQEPYSYSHAQTEYDVPPKAPITPATAPPIQTIPTTTFIAQSSSRDRTLFNATVLELVRLIQAALAISGMFPIRRLHGDDGNVGTGTGGRTGMEMLEMETDGLLCDITVEGIQKWVTDIGESCVGVEVSIFQSFVC